MGLSPKQIQAYQEATARFNIWSVLYQVERPILVF